MNKIGPAGWIAFAIALVLYLTETIGMFLTVVIIIVGIVIDTAKSSNDTKDTPQKPQGNMGMVVGVTAIVIVAMVIALLFGAGSSSSTRSDRPSGQPWKDLGVSEKEYMDIYNFYKYGEHP